MQLLLFTRYSLAIHLLISILSKGTEFSEEYNFCHWAAKVKCSYDPDQEDYEYDEDAEAPGKNQFCLIGFLPTKTPLNGARRPFLEV